MTSLEAIQMGKSFKDMTEFEIAIVLVKLEEQFKKEGIEQFVASLKEPV